MKVDEGRRKCCGELKGERDVVTYYQRKRFLEEERSRRT